MELITADKNDRDAWLCICGNTPADDGFYPCDQRGDELEPTEAVAGVAHYMCAIAAAGSSTTTRLR
jgi:hypothetical protein